MARRPSCYFVPFVVQALTRYLTKVEKMKNDSKIRISFNEEPRNDAKIKVIGVGGGEMGVRGYVTAYDTATGKQVWRFYTVPGNPAAGFESHYSLGGSLYSENIEDYYVTPYDLGYGRVVDFDHEFHGKEALQKLAAGPHKRKVWLIWNPDDVARVVKSSLFDGADRAKFIDMPSAVYSIASYDEVLKGDRSIGFSAWSSYLANRGA